MTNQPGPQRALGSRGQTINASAWPYFDGLIRKVSDVTGVSYDQIIVEGTRTYARQKFLYENRNKPGFNPAYPPDSPYAYHVAGDAVDFGAGAGTRGTPVQKALHQYGASFGIFFEVSNELWHGRCDLSRVPNLDPAGSGATPIEPEDDDMPLTADERAALDYIVQAVKGIDARLATDPTDGVAPGGIIGRLAEIRAAQRDQMNLLAVDTDSSTGIAGGLRGTLRDIATNAYKAASGVKNLESITAVDDGGGLREKINRIIRKIGA